MAWPCSSRCSPECPPDPETEMTRQLRRTVRALGVAIALFAAAGRLAAQQEPRSIDPGMTRAQVVERLGRPKGERSAGEFTYLFYANGCLKKCGIDDVVTLQNDAVVDAIFRGAGPVSLGAA